MDRGGSLDNTLRLWDAETGKPIMIDETELVLSGHSNWVTSVSYRPDGKRIVSGSLDNTLRQWDAKTGEELESLEGKPLVGSAHFSGGRQCELQS